MSLSRRSFFRTAGAAGVGLFSTEWLTARGREAFASAADAHAFDAAWQSADLRRAIHIDSNENAYGPGTAALDAARSVLGPLAGRYPANERDLQAAIAKHLGVEPQNVLIGTGSTEVIEAAVLAFTTSTRHLVAPLPTWENPARKARAIKVPVKDIQVDGDLKLDVPAMMTAATGAGLVFFCNPNNPTGTVHSSATVTKFVEDVLTASPRTTILLDEAYYDFVVDPSVRHRSAAGDEVSTRHRHADLLEGAWDGRTPGRIRDRASRYAEGDCGTQDGRHERPQHRGRCRVDSGRDARREAARADPDVARSDDEDVQGRRLSGQRFTSQFRAG